MTKPKQKRKEKVDIPLSRSYLLYVNRFNLTMMITCRNNSVTLKLCRVIHTGHSNWIISFIIYSIKTAELKCVCVYVHKLYAISDALSQAIYDTYQYITKRSSIGRTNVLYISMGKSMRIRSDVTILINGWPTLNTFYYIQHTIDT